MQNAVQKIQEMEQQLFVSELMNQDFPTPRLSYQWLSAAFIALNHASPSSLGISPQEMKALYDKLENHEQGVRLKLYEFAVLSNNLEAKTIHDFGGDHELYFYALTEGAGHVKYYNEQIAKIREKVRKTAAEKVAGEGKTSIMQPVKAEA